MSATVAAGRAAGLIPDKSHAAVDATGYESRPVSRYFVWRAGRRSRQKRWPKRTAVLDTHSYLFLSARVSRGPSQDAPHLIPAVRDAVRNHPLDTVLADAGYDAEANHRIAREQLRVRATVIALNRRGSRKRPRAKYRRQMVRRFRRPPKGSRSRRVYGQRWQIESGFSRAKRLLGSALRAIRWVNQKSELLLKVITYNLMLLAAS